MFSTLQRALSLSALLAAAVSAQAQDLKALAQTTSVVASTVPSNGDVNPYGIALVTRTLGKVKAGDILVSNFNSSANLQGTGTTIVDISTNGTQTLFAQVNPATTSCIGGVGLTTALAFLPAGWVVVGSLPTTDGTANTAAAGCLLVLDANGNLVKTINGWGINGPWDMTSLQVGDQGFLFVTNVLNGTLAGGGNVVHGGTVVRLQLDLSGSVPFVASSTIIGSGFSERTDPAALVIGPTGVALGGDGTLYVADSLNNRIAAIPAALTRQSSDGTGRTVFSGGMLNDPLGLIVSGTGEILTVNGANGFLVGTTHEGHPAGEILLDSSGNPPGAGALFGLTFGKGGLFYVDDATNTLNILK